MGFKETGGIADKGVKYIGRLVGLEGAEWIHIFDAIDKIVEVCGNHA